MKKAAGNMSSGRPGSKLIGTNDDTGWPSLGPQPQQLPLRPRGGQVFPARLLVNQAEDDVPHDRTPLFDQGPRYQAFVSGNFSRRDENGFTGGGIVASLRGKKPPHESGTGPRRQGDVPGAGELLNWQISYLTCLKRGTEAGPGLARNAASLLSSSPDQACRPPAGSPYP